MKDTENQRLPEGTRRRNLEAILAAWHASGPPTGAVVPRFAALTSEGSPEQALPPRASILVTAENRTGLAESLRSEIEEGRLAHGRIWDLDAAFYPWGNLAMAYEVRIGEELVRPVHVVSVEGRDGGLYLFADRLDAEAFCRAVERRDGRACIIEEQLYDNSSADRLIDSRRGD